MDRETRGYNSESNRKRGKLLALLNGRIDESIGELLTREQIAEWKRLGAIEWEDLDTDIWFEVLDVIELFEDDGPGILDLRKVNSNERIKVFSASRMPMDDILGYKRMYKIKRIS